MRVKILVVSLLLISILIAFKVEAQEENPLTVLERAFQKAASKIAPSVVSLDVERDLSKPEETEEKEEKPVIGREVGPSPGKYYSRPESPVSGVIVTSDGHILTTYFNVKGENVQKITATLPDGKRFPAKVVAWDENVDIALLKIEAKDLPAAKLTDSSKLEQGRFVIAVGRSEDRVGLTVNTGIVSATDRLDGKAIQIDASLNYGNVGGALVDIEGNLIGITCHISTKSMAGQNSGVGFATPSNKISEIMPDLISGKVIKRIKKPFIGVQASEGAEDVKGAEVASVLPNTPAAEAGMQDKDIIIEFNDKKIENWDQLREAIKECKVRQTVKLKAKRRVKREGEEEKEEEVEMQLKVGEYPY